MGQVLAVVMLVGGATVQAQPGTARGFDKDASSSFALLAGGAEINFLLGRVGFEKQVEGLHLSKTDGGANLGSWWATYEGENATGRLTTSASFPNMLDKQHNHFW